MNRTFAKLLRLLLVLLLAIQVWAQTAGPTFPNPGKTSMSKEDQQALGLKVAEQVYQQMPVLPDSSPESKYVSPAWPEVGGYYSAGVFLAVRISCYSAKGD